VKTFLSQLYSNESAVAAIEYALLGSLIAVVIVASVSSVGSQVGGLYEVVREQVVSALSPLER
jgi:pilus assembly protein Flp/PilA